MAKKDNLKIIGANLTDATLIITFFITSFSLLPPNILNKVQANINPNLCILLGFIIYRFITILLFDSTLGMKIFQLIFLNGEEKSLTLKEKSLAAIFVLYQGVEFYNQGKESY